VVRTAIDPFRDEQKTTSSSTREEENFWARKLPCSLCSALQIPYLVRRGVLRTAVGP